MKDERVQVEKAADRIRDELLVTLRELDRRKETVLDFRGQLEKHREVLQWAAVGAGALVVGAGVLTVLQMQARKRHLPRDRWRSVRRAWNHPERLASRAADRPPHIDLARKAAVAFLTTLAVQFAKRAVLRFAPSPAK